MSFFWGLNLFRIWAKCPGLRADRALAIEPGGFGSKCVNSGSAVRLRLSPRLCFSLMGPDRPDRPRGPTLPRLRMGHHSSSRLGCFVAHAVVARAGLRIALDDIRGAIAASPEAPHSEPQPGCRRSLRGGVPLQRRSARYAGPSFERVRPECAARRPRRDGQDRRWLL